jgi:hypothetical protein
VEIVGAIVDQPLRDRTMTLDQATISSLRVPSSASAGSGRSWR